MTEQYVPRKKRNLGRWLVAGLVMALALRYVLARSPENPTSSRGPHSPARPARPRRSSATPRGRRTAGRSRW